jgi:DNA-binding NarL/FixJ family response regulator
MIRVLLADDHLVVREGVRRMLGAHADLAVAGEAADAGETRALVRRAQFDVLLLDINMPGALGLDLLRELRREHPRLRVLVLSIHPEEQLGMRALKAGASGYLGKDCSAAVLADAVRKVAGGGLYVGPRLAERMAHHLTAPQEGEAHELLSYREYQILCLIGAGTPPPAIAAQLNLSVNTVGTYRSRILRKLRLRNTAEVVRYAVEHRLVE